jgi:hypothetical protein
LVTLLEVVPPAVAEDIAVAVVEVEDSAVQAASVPKLGMHCIGMNRDVNSSPT